MKVTREEVIKAIASESFTVLPDGRTTVCQLTLDNGFTVQGMSACVDRKEFDQAKGQDAAWLRALDEAWKMLGFRLAEKMKVVRQAQEPRTSEPGGATYVGTKAIYAVPMTRGEYNVYRGWQIPSDENPEDEGYRVEYLLDGYISWSPKATFEASYEKVSENE